jgi:hypothetical protein
MGLNRKEFTRKPHTGGQLYRWKPETDVIKKGKTAVPKKVGCDATPSSQGIDNDVTYVYETVNNNGVLSRIAYVACDYVE